MNFGYVPATNGTNANAGFMVSDWMEDAAAAERERARRGGTRWRRHAVIQAVNGFASHLVTAKVGNKLFLSSFLCSEFPPSCGKDAGWETFPNTATRVWTEDL